MKDDFASCVQQAYRFLALREHNTKELKAKLKQKGYSLPVIEKTLEFLTSEGSLSETRYIRLFILSNNRRHPEGKVLVLQRLAQKGADKELSKQLADEIYTEDYTSELVQRATEKIIKSGREAELKARLFKLGLYTLV